MVGQLHFFVGAFSFDELVAHETYRDYSEKKPGWDEYVGFAIGIVVTPSVARAARRHAP